MQRFTGIGGIFFKARDPAALRTEGCAVDERVERTELGAFGWVVGPEGNRVELWQPPPGR